jgi:nicotinamidase/pyrazinamidase
MSGILFCDVDTQRDLMHVDGRLYVPGAQTIVPNLRHLTSFINEAQRLRRLATVVRHAEGDEEIAAEKPDYATTFPPYCLAETPGAEKIEETACVDPLEVGLAPGEAGDPGGRVREEQGDVLLARDRFDIFANPHAETVFQALDPERIVIYGVAQDVAIRQAIEGLLERERGDLWLITDASRPMAPKKQADLLESFKERGVRFTTTREVLDCAERGPLGQLL